MIRVWVLFALALFCVPALADPTMVILFAQGLAVFEKITMVQAFFITLGAGIYGSIESRKAAKKSAELARKAYNDSLTNRLITVLTESPPVPYVMGRAQVGCAVVNILTSDKTGINTDGSTYTKPDAIKHLVCVFAGHKCQALNEIKINGKSVNIASLDGDGWATTGDWAEPTTINQESQIAPGATVTYPYPPTILSSVESFTGGGDNGPPPESPLTPSGNSITNTYAYTVSVSVTYQKTRGSVRASWHLGDPSQTVDAYLTAQCPTQWVSTDRLRGLSYAVISLDLENQELQGGVPQITFDVSGLCEVEDPRTSTTGYTENPALLVRWFLMSQVGKGLLSSEIDEDRVIAAANACDVSTSFTVYDEAGTPTTTTGARYTINGTFTSADDPDQVLQQLCEAMGGWAAPSDKWIIQAGAWEAPIIELTEPEQAGPIQIMQHATAFSDTWNSARGRYMPRGETAEAEAPEWSNAAYLAEDGVELWDDSSWPFTDHPGRVRNLQRIAMERARGAFVITCPFKMSAWPVQVGDRVQFGSVEYNIPSDTVWRCTDWQPSPGGPVMLTLQMDTAEMYDEADAPTVKNSPVSPLSNPWGVSAPSGVTAESGVTHLAIQPDGPVNVRALVEWDLPGSSVASGGKTEITWKRQDSDSAWQTAMVDGGEVQAYLPNLTAGYWLTIGVTHINALGKRSDTTWLAHGVEGKDSPMANVSGFAGAVQKGVVVWAWSSPLSADYKATEVRATDADWGDGLHLWKGAADEWTERVTAAGTLTRYARHVDTSGNYSATSASDSETVTPADAIPGQIVGAFYSQFASHTTTAVSRIKFEPDGTVWGKSNSGSYVQLGDWYQPTTSGIGSSNWIRARQDSGDAVAGPALLTWQSLASTVEWSLTQSGLGEKSADLGMLFSTDSGGATVTGNMSLHFDVVVS